MTKATESAKELSSAVLAWSREVKTENPKQKSDLEILDQNYPSRIEPLDKLEIYKTNFSNDLFEIL